MKKIFIIILLFGWTYSCDLDNSITDDYTIESLPIEQVNFPSSFMFDEIYTIEYKYRKPTDCNLFHDLYYNIEGNENILAVFSKKLNSDYCQTLDEELVTRSFDFHCTKDNGTYIFKIWQGKNNNGEDEYLIYEVPIIE